MSDEFSHAMKDLLEISRKILLFDASSNVFATKKEKKKSTKHPILKAFNNYVNDYAISNEEGNKDDLITAFRQTKIVFLKGWRVDDFIKSSNISIYSGAAEPDDKRRLMVSAIYNIACRQRDNCKDSLKGLPVEAFDEKEELLFPIKFLLYLYRAFSASLSKEEFGDDITKINGYITEIEQELKIAPLVKKTKEGEKSETGDNFADGLYGMAKDFIGKMGVQIPDDIKMPSGTGNILDVAAGLFQKPETQTFITETFDSMRGARSFDDAFMRLASKIQEPGSIDKFKKVAEGFMPTATATTS